VLCFRRRVGLTRRAAAFARPEDAGADRQGSSAEEALTISRESAEGVVAGECFDVGAVCDGAGSVLWAWLISTDDQQTSSEVFSYEVVEISYVIQIHT